MVVKKAISYAGVFFGTSGFNMRRDFCSGGVDAFVAEYSALFAAFIMERRKTSMLVIWSATI